MPAAGVYFVKFWSSAACAAAFDRVRRREVRLAGAEVDDSTPDRRRRSTVAVTVIVGRSRNPRGPIRKSHHAFLVSTLPRRRSSTSSGTRPFTRPPSENTSLMSRELM